MGIFTDGDNEEDELFDMFMLNELNESTDKGASTNHSGGCLTSLLLIMTVPIGIVFGVLSILA